MTRATTTTAGKSKAAKKPEAVEVWAPVPGFEGFYEVSSLGRVRSLIRQTATGFLGGRVLTGVVSRNSYLRVTLSRGGRSSRMSIHRAVLAAFCGPADGREARHLDGVRSNNRLANLAWGTRSENAADRMRHGTHVNNAGERHGNARLTDDNARAILAAVLGGELRIRVARRFGVSPQTVGRIVSGKGWKHIAGEGLHA